MYIHSYQIHNVLNVYRKKLSEGKTDGRDTANAGKAPLLEKDILTISKEGQRKTLFEKISNEIVDRITQFRPETHFDESAITPKPASVDKSTSNMEKQKESAFTYTIIDQNNQKSTNMLPIHPFRLPANETASSGPTCSDVYSPANDDETG